jgi:molecular chaperone GrpE (heat shock protein)
LIQALLIAPPLSQSQLTYGRADFINLQRRTEQEKVSTKDFAIQGFASDLLATVDILTTALKHVNQPISQENKDLIALFNGVEMTRQRRHPIRPDRREIRPEQARGVVPGADSG